MVTARTKASGGPAQSTTPNMNLNFELPVELESKYIDNNNNDEIIILSPSSSSLVCRSAALTALTGRSPRGGRRIMRLGAPGPSLMCSSTGNGSHCVRYQTLPGAAGEPTPAWSLGEQPIL